MNARNTIMLILINHMILITLSITSTSGQSTQKNLLDQLNRITNADWQERKVVIDSLRVQDIKPSSEEKMKLLYIYEKESNYQEEYIGNQRKKGLSLNEAIDKFTLEIRSKGYLAYFRSFTDVIVTIDDTKAIPPILKGLTYYGGSIVPSDIIAFGDKAIDPLLAATQVKDESIKHSAYFILSIWVNAPVTTEDYAIDVKKKINNEKLLGKIKDLFISALNDQDSQVRLRAAYGLGAFPDEVTLRALEICYKNDTYQAKYSKRYTVREEIKRSIDKIKKTMHSQ